MEYITLVNGLSARLTTAPRAQTSPQQRPQCSVTAALEVVGFTIFGKATIVIIVVVADTANRPAA